MNKKKITSKNPLKKDRDYNSKLTINKKKEIKKILSKTYRKQYFLLIKLFLIYSLFCQIASKRNKIYIKKRLSDLSSLNEIFIKINGSGTQKILNSNYIYKPNQVYVQGNSTSYLVDDYNRITGLQNNENTIIMKWDNNLQNCSYMFSELNNIIEVDLSKFNISEVRITKYMFSDCVNLKNIIFNNSNSFIINEIAYMFYNCQSLESLDLSSFDTSNVMNMAFLFSGCISLTSLNVSIFNTSGTINMMNLFGDCNSLKSLDLSTFNTFNVHAMANMFKNCYSLTSLNLSNFETTNCYSMSGMFYGCKELISLDLSNFITINIDSFSIMFSECQKLIYLDISNFDTSRSEFMMEMFKNCSNLEYINFSNYIDGEYSNMTDMFNYVPSNLTYCSKDETLMPNTLKKLKDKNCIINDCSEKWKIKQKKVISEKSICIYDCSEDNEYKYEYKNICYKTCPNETYLSKNGKMCLIKCPADLPFELSGECFSSCISREFYIGTCKINNQNVRAKEYIVNSTINGIKNGSINSLLVNVLNGDKKDLIINNNNTEIFQISSTNNQRNNLNDNKTSINIGECEDILKKIYNINSNDTLIIFKIDYFLEDFLIPITEYEIFHPQTHEKLELNYCKDSMIEVYIPVKIEENDLYKHDPYSEYYKGENNDILLERKKIFNKNYLSLCENNCLFKGYNNQTKKVLCKCEIKTEILQLSEILNKKDELLYYMIDKESEMNIIFDSNSYIPYSSYNSDIILCLFKKNITKECEDSIKFRDLLNHNYIPLNLEDSIDKVFELFTDEYKNKSLNINEDTIIKGDGVTYQITTTENQKNNPNNIISSIDLGECEEILKKIYKINEPLIILKVDIRREEIISTQVEYQVFNPINLNRLNLSLCYNSKINIYTPIELDQEKYKLAKLLKEQGYDLFDSSNRFYNDTCTPFTSFNNTDVLLRDRKKHFYISNITFCEDNCQYKEFDIKTLKANCKCEIKTEVNSGKAKFSPNIIIENFYKFEKYSNLAIMKCYKLAFNLDKLKKNYGSVFMIILGSLFLFIMIIIFSILNKKINVIINSIIIEYRSLKLNLNKKEKEEKIKRVHSKNKARMILKSNKKNKINNPSKKNSKNVNNYDKFNYKNKNKRNHNQSEKNNFNSNRNNESNSLNIIISKNNNNSIDSNKIMNYKLYSKFSQNKNIKIVNNVNFIDKIILFYSKSERKKYFTEYELNSLKYEYALEIDNRPYLQFYWSLIKQNHLIIFTFFVHNDYNIFLLKVALFLISIGLFLFMNALFFKDESLHKIYEDEGEYNFIYHIPQMIYSVIVSQIISFLLENLSMFQDQFINIKQKINLKEIKEEIQQIKKSIKKRCFLFLIIGIILLFGFWYYLSVFCAVYYNMQISLIKNNIISFISGMIYPFFLNLIPGVLRVYSLQYKVKCLYIFSKILIKIIEII